MKLFVRFVIALLLLGAIFGGIFGYKFLVQFQPPEGAGEPVPANVIASEVITEEWRGEQQAVGGLTAVDRVEVSTEVPGLIESIAFDSGDAVAAGDVLVELDKSVDRAELEGLEAEAELARIEFDRAQDLLPERAISQSEFDSARARLDSANAALNTQEARLRQKTIRAPFDGLLGLRRVSTGQFISPGTAIVELQQLDPIYADFSLPERFLPMLFKGQTVRVTTGAFDDEAFEGEIQAIESGLQVQTRSVSVRALLDNPDDRLRPGMFARVTVLEPETQALLTVPATAINFNVYGDFAIRISETDDGPVAEQVQVRTGQTRDGRVEVLEGLEEGDRVVGAGLNRVRPGQPLTIDDTVNLDPAGVSGR